MKFKSIAIISLTLFSVSAMADSWFSLGGSGVKPVNNPQWLEECGACHFPYQPGLLPSRSWKKMFANLDDHFGENAELAQDELESLLQYAVENGADKSNHKRSAIISRSLRKNDEPQRISTLRYIVRKHDELSRRHVQNNPEVKSLSHCQACHTDISNGSFSESEIEIPGFRGWDDD